MQTGAEVGDNRRKASSTAGSPQPNLHLQGRKAWGSSSSPERGQPSLPQGRAHLRSTQPAKLGPHRAESARPSAAAPGAPPAGTGVGRGGHRPANSGSDGESEPHPLRQPQTYLQLSGSPGQRPRARGRAPRRSEPLPGTPSISEGEGRGETLGGLPRASAARREGRGDLALPLALGRRRRRHFAFHSVSPPPYSAAGFPDVGISRRRLRGPRTGGFCPSGRLARAPPAASRPPPVPLRVRERRPASPPPDARGPDDSPRWIRPGPRPPKATHLLNSLSF